MRSLFFYACALGARVPHTPAETRRGRQRTVRRSPTASSNRGKMSLCVAGADRNRLLRRPVPPSVAQTRGSEGPQINVRPRRGKGKPMPTRALSARALSGGLCVAGADQNRLLRRPVPPSVAQTRGSEGPQINVRPRRGKGKPMPMHALSAHALSGDLCVAGADQNRLLRRPVPPSVAQNFGREADMPCHR